MEAKFKISGLQSLTDKEIKLINGGGPWWYWLGQTIHKVVNVLNKIEQANIEAPVSVAEWN